MWNDSLLWLWPWPKTKEDFLGTRLSSYLCVFYGIQVSSSESRDFANQCIGHVGVPQDRLNLLIRLCLTDSNFPAFVEAVEKELTSLTSSENDD